MKRAIKKTKGRGGPIAPKGREKGKGRMTHSFFILILFFKSNEILGLLPKKRLFKVLSLTLTS